MLGDAARNAPPPSTWWCHAPLAPLPPPHPPGRAGGARLLRQLVTSQVVTNNPAYAPNIATTVDGFGGEAAALSNPHSAGACVWAARMPGQRAA